MSYQEDGTVGPIWEKAAAYPNVVVGTACTQDSFKVGKKSFFFLGMQGGRYKAMFKLEESIPQATDLAATAPQCYGVGKFGWVSVRFDEENPVPETVWTKWLDESYRLATVKKRKKKAAAK